MNKLLQKVAKIFLGLSMAAGVGVAIGAGRKDVTSVKAADATADFTLSSANNVTVDGVTASFAKSSGSTAPTWYAAGLRLYANNTVTISSASTITGVSFNWEKQGNKAFASATASPGSYTHPSNTGTGTWSGSATSITFTLGSSGQLQLNTFSVTYSSGGGTTTYTVTYNGNGNTSGSVPEDESSPYASGASVTVLGNTGSLAKTNYSFGGWNTSADGSGNARAVGSTFSMPSSNVILYAVWNGNSYSITYKDQGNVDFSGTHESGYPTTHTYGTATTLKSASKSGYTFGGWFTTQDCSGSAVTSLGATAYTAGITLYAKWAAGVSGSTLTPGSNGTTTQNGSTPTTWSNAAKTSDTWLGDIHFEAGGTGTNGYYYSSDATWRFYSGGSLTISIPSGYRFTSIVIYWKTGIPNTPTNMDRDGTSSPTTYTPSTSSTNLNSVTFSRGSSNFLLSKAVISYEEAPKLNQTLTVSANSAYTNETITVSSDATNTVSWSVVSGEGTTASGAQVTSAGVISVAGAGTVTVKASATGYNDATVQVTFNAAAYSVSVSPNSFTKYKGQSQTLTATPTNITPIKYVWTTEDASIAQLGDNVGSTSVETAGNEMIINVLGEAAATIEITVTAVEVVGTKETSAVSTLTVTASAHSLTLSPNSAQTVLVGESVSITATSNASGAYSVSNVTATSDDSAKVTVNGNASATLSSGSSFTLAGVAVGSATITFTTSNNDTESIVVTVVPPEKNTIYGKYQLCTSIDDLVVNGHYVIGNVTTGDGYFISTESKDKNRPRIDANVNSSNIVEVVDESEGSELLVFKLEGSAGSWKFLTKNYEGTAGYLANNGDKALRVLTAENAGTFSISFNASDAASEPLASVITATNGSEQIIRYNSNSTGLLFNCYGSGQDPVYLYKQIDEVPISTISIPTTYGASAPLLYEGQNYTFAPTYNEGSTAPTTPTSELSIVSGGTYIEVSGLTVSAKVGAITSGTTATAQVKVIATDGSGTESNICTITITKAEVIGVEVTQDPTKTSYVEGQTLDLTGMVTTLTWNYGGTTTLEGGASGISTSPSLATQLTVNDHNGIEVSVTYAGITSEEGDGFEIEVVAKAVTSIKSWTDLTTSYPIDSTLEADGSIVVEYNDGTESEPLSVASLWANSEVTFKLGDVTVTPGTTTLSSSDNGKNLTIIYSGHQKSVAISVKNVSYQFLTRIESTDGLVAGETYIIAAKHAGKTYVMTSEVVTKPAAVEWSESWSDTYKVDSADFTVDSLRADINTWGWTLGGSSGNWTFTGTDGKSLSYSSGTNFNSTGTNTWTISTSGITNSGYWKIANTDHTDRVITFREGSTMAFAPYANSNPHGNTDGTGEYHYVEIYRVLDVANTSLYNWNDTLNHFDYLTCSDAGSYEFDTGKSWSNMASSFADLDIEVRAYFKHASYSYDGSDTTATYGTDSDVAEFVCRYDYIVDKYGWTDFIGRDGTTYDLFNSSGAKPLMLLNIKNTNTVAIIVIISMVSVTTIGGYFFLRKRKEN